MWPHSLINLIMTEIIYYASTFDIKFEAEILFMIILCRYLFWSLHCCRSCQVYTCIYIIMIIIIMTLCTIIVYVTRLGYMYNQISKVANTILSIGVFHFISLSLNDMTYLRT